MIFSRDKIVECIGAGLIEITPFNSLQLNANSYNLTVGNWAYFVKLDSEGRRQYYGPKWFADGESIPMPWGVGILGMTKERVITIGNIVAQMKARSTTGREFFTICADAGLGDIGYSNYWTCEFSNHLKGTAWLPVGSEFGQLIFNETTPLYTNPYAGQYMVEFPHCMVPRKYRLSVEPWDDSILFA